QEVFQNDKSCVNHNAVEIQDYFEINDLKAQLQDKDTSISKLKDTIKSLKKNNEEKNVHLEPINEELENSVSNKLRRNNLLDGDLDLACKYATRIQELLVYVQDTFPNAIIPSTKKVAVTPMNNVKKVRLAEPLTSSSNIKQVESSNTLYSNTPVLSSIGVKCSNSICGSKPPSNKKNDRISQTPSRNKKNKVEAQPRKVSKMNRVVKPVCDVDVKQSLSNANSDILCATCNKSMFDGVHDKCLLDLVQNGNNHAKSAKKHKKQNIWKPTGHVFTKVGFKWKPTGRTFTIVGNSCPLTRFTSTNVVPPKQTTSHSDEIQKPEIKVKAGKPKKINVRNLGCPDCTVRFGNDQIARIMGYGDYQLGNVIILKVAFWKNTCFIRNLEGVDLLSGSRDTNLYTISLDDMLKSSPICLLSKASKTKSWLWHRRLSHLNFVIVNDYSRFTWVRFLKTKDEALAAIIKCIKNIQVCLKATVLNVRTDNGTGFVNQTLRECVNYYTDGVIRVLPPRTAEETLAREKERKARTILLMALPEDHLAKKNPKAMVTVDGESVDWTAHAEDEQEDFAFMAYGNSSSDSEFGLGYGDHRYDGILSYENEVLQSVFMNKENDLEKQPVYDRFVTTGGMHAVLPPMIRNYIPSRPDIEVDYSQFTYGPKQTQPSESESQSSEFDTCESNISIEPSELVSEPVVNESNVECQPKVWSDAPIIEEYELDYNTLCF
ncbi:integrase, catalytic region, zinc finger, CCHC-type containing protein, partial [Tanacetum coccineum]